jgi:hypothetical protein
MKNNLMKLILKRKKERKKTSNMDNNWSVVFSTDDIFQADVIKNMLDANNIDAIIMNQKDSAYLFGIVKIYTKKENIEKAKNLILNE